ncbi:hypothetical protein BGZ65_006690, partial [Modicella reniformis]
MSTSFICQESFRADNTTSCLRYTKLKQCVKDGSEQQLNFYCVDQNTISIGGTGHAPPPGNISMAVFLCSMDSCPTEAPASPGTKKGKKDPGSGAGAGTVAADKKTMTMSGFFILALL